MKTFSKNLKTSDDHASGKAPLMKKRMLHSWYTVINYSSLAVQFSLFTLFYSRHLLLFIFLASLICRNSMLPGYADTDTGTRYGDTPIRHFSKNKDTGIRQYI